MGKIADILQERGETDEALRIRREDELPVFERLGDVREWAITMSRIADILRRRGEIDEAIRILRDEALPSLERLGDVHSLLKGRLLLARWLINRGTESDRQEARKLLLVALDAASKLRSPQAGRIEQILRSLK
jgi:hypothetical protein